MAILEDEVWVNLNNNTNKYYEEKGYEIPMYKNSRGKLVIKRNTKILVKLVDLPEASHAELTKICDDCGKHTKDQPYKIIITHRNKGDGKDRCLKCGQNYRDIIRKENVPYEKSLEHYAKNNNKEHLLEEFSVKNEKPPSKISYGTHDKYWWNCPECKNAYYVQVNSRTSNGSSCPECKASKGEKRIRKWLEENIIEFEPQKEYEGLVGVGGNPLSYDFYLPDYNLLIEFQGEFHDGASRGYTKKNLERQQEHDKRKKEYTERNNIELLEIWYQDFENIEEILENKLIK